MEWTKETWALLASWGTTAVAVLNAIRATYAAERDRQALKQSELEREKLKLEIARLKNGPTVVADRRAIYDRLCVIVARITRDAKVALTDIADLHDVVHDAEFRFPPDVVGAIREFLHAAIGLHVSGMVLEGGPGRISTEEWHKQVQINHDALTKIAAFEQGKVGIFKPHLSL
jgi:hypothetical protein